MQANAIERVSEAIAALLAGAITDSKAAGSVYVGSLEGAYALAGAALRVALILYRIEICPALRNDRHATTRLNDFGVADEVDSTPLDLHYMVSILRSPPAPGGAPGGNSYEDFRLLGYVIQALEANSVLTGVRPNVAGGPAVFTPFGEAVRLSMQPASSEELGRIWALFPKSDYQMSLLYLASPVWIDPPALPAPAPVRTVVLPLAPQVSP